MTGDLKNNKNNKIYKDSGKTNKKQNLRAFAAKKSHIDIQVNWEGEGEGDRKNTI